jgi:hypothetical protein
MDIIRNYTLFLFGVMPMNAQNQTENLTIHHKVKDYAAWRKGYDDHEKARHAAGVTNGRVFRSAEDPNDVLILQDVADMAKARTWLGGDELKAAMTKAGVIGSPNVRVVISRLAGRDKPCSAIYPLAQRMLAPMATWTNAVGAICFRLRGERHLENIT